MDTFSRVEFPKEELKEEAEEMAETLENFVQSAVKSIYTDIRNDVDSIARRSNNFVRTVFPFLGRWKSDERLFWDDLRIALVTVALASVVYLAFFGYRRLRWNRKKRSSRRSHRRASSFHEGLFSQGRRRGEGVNAIFDEHRADSDVAKLARGHPRSRVEDEETQEERFERNWPKIMESGYQHLVLPPTCKRVAKPRMSKRRSSRHVLHKHKNARKRRESKHDSDDDDVEDNTEIDINSRDHPVTRLLYYAKNFLAFIFSFLRYDYMSTSAFIINWCRTLFKRHQHSHPSEEDVTDNDNVDKDSDRGRRRPHASKFRESLRRLHRVSSRKITLDKSKGAKTLARGTLHTIPSNDQYLSTDDIDNAAIEQIRNADSLSDIDEIRSIDTKSATEDSNSTQTSTEGRSADGTVASQSKHHLASSSTPSTPGHIAVPSGRHSFNHAPSAEGNELQSKFPNEKVSSRQSLPPQSRLANLGAGERTNQQFAKAMHNNILPRPEARHVPHDKRLSDEHRDPSGHYFETAPSQRHMDDIYKDGTVPDKNGYLMGEEHLPDSSWTPLLVFVNSRSGSQQGPLLINQLRGLLNPIQVCDLADGGPDAPLESFSRFTRLRILVCGGDGTVSWVVSAIEKLNLPHWPPIAILPLGTGNDLARIHGWGPGYSNESLTGVLDQVSKSYVSWLDRWEMTIENKKGRVKNAKQFFNYLGVGADAQAALQVHMLRESRPQLFFSRVVNKLWYGLFGAEDLIKATNINLPYEIKLYADGVAVPLPPDSQGIIILNIDSYSGGVPLWSTATKRRPDKQQESRPRQMQRSRSLGSIRDIPRYEALENVDDLDDFRFLNATDEEKFERVTVCDKPSSCQDGLLDIVSIRGAFHLGQIRVGLGQAHRLCQCQDIRIVLKKKIAVQIDGEPWMQNACTLRIRRKKDAAIMLHRSPTDGHGVEIEMNNLLDWAQEKNYIDQRVHDAMMKEFSRRIEEKTRQRRTKTQDNNIMTSLTRAMGNSSHAEN